MSEEIELDIDDDEQPTFEQLKKVYIQSQMKKGKADKTENGYKYSLGRFEDFLEETGLDYTDIDKETNLAPDLDSMDAMALSGDNMLDYFIIWLRDDAGYAKSTVITTYNYVQPFIKFLLSEGLIEYDAPDNTTLSEYVEYGTTAQKEEWGDDYVAVDEEQFEHIYENAPAPVFRNRLILSLGWETGMRRSEVAALKLGDINLDEKHIDIPAIKSKDRRSVWFGEKVRTNLDIWINSKRDGYYNSDSDYLFVSNDSRSKEGLSPKRVSKIFQKAAEDLPDQDYIVTKSGQERAKYSFHSLRHGFAERFITNIGGEAGIYELKEIMGHASVSTTEVYLTTSKDEYLHEQMRQNAPRI
ncbi:tyrosine-type recombinase/integrase [Halolamina salifodinae]|uniref:Site-specific recombinase XerD n=1 Tax=Halolamina salifodinae TaxID=1202767 RepID=A0A8T4GXX7_9EURY|nr:site-specific integrase [Halolamina salifodinae]MBP1986963.1 site-specific recombinase XerD [Halolamina salifodinae]